MIIHMDAELSPPIKEEEEVPMRPKTPPWYKQLHKDVTSGVLELRLLKSPLSPNGLPVFVFDGLGEDEMDMNAKSKFGQCNNNLMVGCHLSLSVKVRLMF